MELPFQNEFVTASGNDGLEVAPDILTVAHPLIGDAVGTEVIPHGRRVWAVAFASPPALQTGRTLVPVGPGGLSGVISTLRRCSSERRKPGSLLRPTSVAQVIRP